jgi:hypothetical protein
VTDIAVREVWRGRVWRAFPCRVVEERADLLALWHPEHAPVLRPFAGAQELRIPGDEEWTLEERPASSEVLTLVRPGARYSIGLVWRGRDFDHWYINFERDHRRTPISFDIVDEKLDLIVAPDGGVRWKDEDELAEAGRVGYLDEADVRRVAERVLRDPPWPTGWEDWRAHASWEMPRLPEGWDVV